MQYVSANDFNKLFHQFNTDDFKYSFDIVNQDNPFDYKKVANYIVYIVKEALEFFGFYGVDIEDNSKKTMKSFLRALDIMNEVFIQERFTRIGAALYIHAACQGKSLIIKKQDFSVNTLIKELAQEFKMSNSRAIQKNASTRLANSNAQFLFFCIQHILGLKCIATTQEDELLFQDSLKRNANNQMKCSIAITKYFKEFPDYPMDKVPSGPIESFADYASVEDSTDTSGSESPHDSLQEDLPKYLNKHLALYYVLALCDSLAEFHFCLDKPTIEVVLNLCNKIFLQEDHSGKRQTLYMLANMVGADVLSTNIEGGLDSGFSVSPQSISPKRIVLSPQSGRHPDFFKRNRSFSDFSDMRKGGLPGSIDLYAAIEKLKSDIPPPGHLKPVPKLSSRKK